MRKFKKGEPLTVMDINRYYSTGDLDSDDIFTFEGKEVSGNSSHN